MMDDAPDYRELSDEDIEQVLEAAGTPLHVFDQLSPDLQESEWITAWSLWQYNLANEREAPTSASAELENQTIAPPPEPKVLWAAPKWVRSPEGVQNPPNPTEESRHDDHDIDNLFDEWIERREESPDSPPSPESLWPGLPPDIIEKVKCRIEAVSNVAPFFVSESSSHENDERIDLSILKKGYRPVPGSSWELVERLDDGQSGFGAVWRGENSHLRQSAIFKFCKRPSHKDTLATFSTEVTLTRKLASADVVKVQAEYLEAPIPFLILQDTNGATLDKVLARVFDERFISLNEAAGVIFKITQSVAMAHIEPLPIVHRDIKPQNILVTGIEDVTLLQALHNIDKGKKEDNVTAANLSLARFLLIDFGIGSYSIGEANSAPHIPSQSTWHSKFATHNYASPQQRQKHPAHTSDDVYSLGVIWYEMLFGKVGNGAPDMKDRKWRQVLIDKGGSEKQVAVLEKSLANDRADRFRTAAELWTSICDAYPCVESAPTLSDCLHEAIRNFNSNELRLDEITELSPSGAKALSKWEGQSLCLNGLHSLTFSVAEALAKWHPKPIQDHDRPEFDLDKYGRMLMPDGGSLHLNGLEMLPEEVAELLGSWNGERQYLFLGGLRKLSEDAAKKLVAPSKQKWLVFPTTFVLSGIASLDEKVAAALASGNDIRVALNGLVGLDVNVAKALVGGGIETLYLDRVARFEQNALKALVSGSVNYLYARGLEVHDAEVVRTLCGGNLSDFSGISSLNESAAEGFAAPTKICSLTLHVRELSAKVAKELAKWQGTFLSFPALESLEADAADALAKWNYGELRLDKLRTLERPTAEAIVDWRGIMLSFRGLVELPVDVAETLADWGSGGGEGDLIIDCIRTLSSGATESLVHIAAQKGSHNLMKLLLHRAAVGDVDLNRRSREGWTPLASAIYGKHWNVERLLKDAGASVLCSTADGEDTALHLAAMAGNVRLIDLLITHGADIHRKNAAGQTPLNCAIDAEHWDAVRALVPTPNQT